MPTRNSRRRQGDAAFRRGQLGGRPQLGVMTSLLWSAVDEAHVSAAAAAEINQC